MMQPVFQPLFAQYARVIQGMTTRFNSHEFIARLAQEHQRDYIEALAAYRHRPTPFQAVHAILARHLNTFVPGTIVRDGEVTHNDIFGDPCNCAKWRKVN